MLALVAPSHRTVLVAAAVAAIRAVLVCRGSVHWLRGGSAETCMKCIYVQMIDLQISDSKVVGVLHTLSR